LLEHTLSLARLVQLTLRNYAFLDRDLLLAGALLHDLGKSRELSPELGFDYTDEGRLLGHILIGMNIIESKIALVPEFPAPLALQLKHLLVSHHGELEFGSPKPPMTLEAFCLHQLDNLDAKLAGIREYLASESASQERWTAYHRVHERYFYIPESFSGLAKPEESAEKKAIPALELFADTPEDLPPTDKNPF